MNTATTEQVIAIAKDVLSGSIGIVEACRILVPLLSELDERLQHSEAARTLVGVESETDTFPLGAQRPLWDPEALQERDRELHAYVARARSYVEDACRSLIAELER